MLNTDQAQSVLTGGGNGRKDDVEIGEARIDGGRDHG